MSERRGRTAAEQAAKAAANRTAGRRKKPAAKPGGKSSSPAAAKAAPGAVGNESAEPRRPRSPLAAPDAESQPQDRGLRRAIFLAELAEAKELRKRVAPRRARAAELHARLLRTFRY